MTTQTTFPEDILNVAQSLRWEVGVDFNEKLMESIYIAWILRLQITRLELKDGVYQEFLQLLQVYLEFMVILV